LQFNNLSKHNKLTVSAV